MERDVMAGADRQWLDRCLAFCAHLRAGQTDALDALEQQLKTIQTASPIVDVPIEIQSRILAQLNEPVIALDLGGYVTGWNKGAEALFGYAAAEALGRHVLFLYADDPDEQSVLPEAFLEQGSPYFEVRRRKRSGEVIRVGMTMALLRDADGEPVGMAANLSDLTARTNAQEAWRLHASIIENSDQGILITDAHERIVSVNSAFTAITGYAADEAIGMTPDLLRSGIHDADFRAQVRSAMRGAGPWQGEIVGKRKSGELFPQSVSISVVRNETGEITHAFSIFSDITVLRAAEERMNRLVNYDSLTGLPNRTLFKQLLDQSIAQLKRTNTYGAVVAIDIKRFSAVNDALGFEVGDELLRQIGSRFRATLRDEDMLARVAGDEFVAGLVSVQKREHAGIVAQKLLAVLEPPFDINGHRLHIGASVGISVYPEDGEETDGLIRSADAALKKVMENAESGYLYYSPELNQRAKDQMTLESELRQALAGGQLMLYYQPKVSLRSGQIVGAEALLRWKHPEKGMVPPGKFVPVAEETGLILELGQWVLEESVRQIGVWQAEGGAVPPIAVNLSARQFDAELPNRVQDVMDRHGVRAAQLKLEITESLLMHGAETVLAIMNRLVAMGLSLALDDFGTGYSSLAYLKRFPIDTLKIDRAFVIGVPKDDNDCAIAKAIVTMGQQLRQEIVAEGVETIEQMQFLRALGCDQLQGYLFSPPIPADDFIAMVRGDRRLSF